MISGGFPSIFLKYSFHFRSLSSWQVAFSFALNMVFLLFYCLLYRFIGLAVRAFANGPGDWGSIPGRVIPKTQKMVLDAPLLNTQHYIVWIKGKMEQFRERGCALPDCIVAIEKGAFGSPLTKVANFTFTMLFMILSICLWMYSNCSFLHVFVSSFWGFLSFCTLVFICFLLLSKVFFYF